MITTFCIRISINVCTVFASFPVLFFTLVIIIFINSVFSCIIWWINIDTLHLISVAGSQYFEHFEVFTFNDDILGSLCIYASLLIIV